MTKPERISREKYLKENQKARHSSVSADKW